MFCKNCGKQIDDDAKFCEYCGASMDDNTDPVSNESAKRNAVTVSDGSVKKTSFKPLLVTTIVLAVILILVIAGTTLFDKFIQERSDKAIQNVQNSYFEFLPEMTVGDLLYEYYGEDNWVYDSSEKHVEFFGTNKKDNSGISITFKQTDSDTVSTTNRMLRSEGEAAHSINAEEFETYILSLYDLLNGADKDVPTETAIETEAETTESTTAPVMPTVAPTQENAEESKYYLAYLMLLNEMDASVKREYGDMYIPYYRYYLYDINKDGFRELILHVGESEAEAGILFYTIDEESEEGFIELGQIGGGHTILVEKDGKLYSDFGHQGYQVVKEIQMVGWHGVWSVVEETVFEQDNLSDYKSYGTAIEGYDLSDTSAIEALCPKELLEDKPHVDAYVETYSLSGRDGSKIRLYLNGDFSAVSVQIHNEEYTSEVEFYAKEDFDEYIEMNFNPFAQPPSVAYVTPYNDSGVAGDVVTCDIPTETSGTIQTGGISYPIQDKEGQINCHGGVVAGFTTDYVVNGGAAQRVRDSLGDTWHVTAKNVCDNYGITWYELWDTDDGDYYGWVDEDFIDFY